MFEISTGMKLECFLVKFSDFGDEVITSIIYCAFVLIFLIETPPKMSL